MRGETDECHRTRDGRDDGFGSDGAKTNELPGTRSALPRRRAAIGAMLAWRTPATGPLAWMLRSFGASKAFPWEGKTFKSETSEIGSGINRVRLLGKRRWFPFKTRFEASFLDGQPTFRLDYSDPANPPFIRSIVDEVREVAPRLYLGPAALLVKGKPRPILFFAVSLQ